MNLKFLREKVSRKGLWTNLHCISQDLGLSVIKTPEYSSRVCTKCALKIRNAVELCRFVKDTLNPQPVPVEEDIIDENSDPYQYRSKRMSKSPSNSLLKGTSEELSAYLNRFVLQEVKVTCPFCNASLLELLSLMLYLPTCHQSYHQVWIDQSATPLLGWRRVQKL